MSDADEVKRLRSDNMNLTRMLADALAREVVSPHLAELERLRDILGRIQDGAGRMYYHEREELNRLRVIVDAAIAARSALLGDGCGKAAPFFDLLSDEVLRRAQSAATRADREAKAKHSPTCPKWWTAGAMPDATNTDEACTCGAEPTEPLK